jgi:REP element-mobilizing transposase RayT
LKAPSGAKCNIVANTYTQIYIQVVFAVSERRNLLPAEHKEELHKYITGIVSNQHQKLVAINSMPDHVHILIGLKPDVALSSLVREIKASSSKFINERRWLRGKFNWQEGFGAFSYAHSQLSDVISYIQNQETHHARSSFREEYLLFLKKFDVKFDSKYVFEFIEDIA